MLVLAIETSSATSSVAVMKDERLLSEITTDSGLTHSVTLHSHIKAVLEMAGAGRSDVDGVAVSIGPGSFTGLRIGLAAAKAIAYAWGAPIVGVPTLSALAANLPVDGVTLMPLVDAQKNNVYMAMYAWRRGSLVTLREEAVMPLASALGLAGEAAPGDVILLGDAARKKLAGEPLPEKFTAAPPTHIMPRASSVARLGLFRLSRGERDELMGLEPFYIRRSEAEVLWEARHS